MFHRRAVCSRAREVERVQPGVQIAHFVAVSLALLLSQVCAANAWRHNTDSSMAALALDGSQDVVAAWTSEGGFYKTLFTVAKSRRIAAPRYGKRRLQGRQMVRSTWGR